MKKRLLVISVILLLAIFIIRRASGINTATIQPPTPTTIETHEVGLDEVGIIIDTGDNSFLGTEKYIENKSALSYLEDFAKEKEILLEVKKYDFGAMVVSLAGKQNSNSSAWIYYINSQSADTGADSFTPAKSDLIEWKYEQIQN